MGVFDPIIELSKGLGETLRSFLFEKTVTYQYPEETVIEPGSGRGATEEPQGSGGIWQVSYDRRRCSC